MPFPHYSQLEYSDCGATCLKIILKHYKKNCSLEYLRELCETTREGVSMADISNAARKLKLCTAPVLTTTEWLSENAILPCIIHWKQDHFVVLYKITKKFFYISDPAYGKVKLRKEAFNIWWKEDSEKGIALFVEPEDDFLTLNVPFKNGNASLNSGLAYFKNVTEDQRKFFWMSLAVMIGILSIVYIFPKTIQLTVDSAIKDRNISILFSIFAFQVTLLLSQGLFIWLQDWLRVKISMNVSIKMISNLLSKLVRLPVRFFDIKTPADILQRINDQKNIESFITEQLLQTLFSLILAIILTIRLFFYNFYIGAFFTAVSCLSILWVFLFYKWRQRIDYTNFRLASENYNLVNEFIYGMVEIKINDAQNKKITQWSKLQDRIFKLKMKTLQLGVYQNTGIQILTQLKNISITLFCGYSIIKGDLSFGVMLSIGYIVGMLSAPIDSLVGFSKSAQEAQLSFFRLDEIRSRQDEIKPDHVPPPTITRGILLKNISFKYEGSNHDYVLNDVSFYIPTNKTTAIVGSSGSGKSTLLKLLLNFYIPQKGSISLDDQDIRNINPDLWRKRCGIVMQDGYLFSGTIGENIALGDDNPDMDRLWYSVKMSCLDDFICSLPMKFDTKIGNTGMGLSGGQKQRLFIARAIYHDPDFIFFDEATSNLDANNERKIMQNLTSFFKNKTVIIIAHRLSTVKKADQIIVLEHGRVIERGMHNSLIDTRGRYFELIKDQLELGGV